mmetsp:Transcript_29597/g.52844  ORF Transcript_29597/g.52844 Transcript_29597/m.52844 type:complete len:216 (+) Transcript_29597:249-896(+)
MESSWRRIVFIICCSLLCFLDLTLDIYYYFRCDFDNSTLQTIALAFLLLQPALYYSYYQLGLFAYCLCDRDSEPHRGRLLIAILFQAPLYTILAEFKLLMSPLYMISQPKVSARFEDRIKHDLLGPVVVHCVLESVPMMFVQAFNNSKINEWQMTQTASLSTSCMCVLLGGLAMWMIVRMNTGGLWWINTPKADVCLVTKMSCLKSDNLVTRFDN